MAQNQFYERWDRLFAQKRQSFLNSDCRQAMDVSSFEDLSAALQTMASRYQASGFPDFIHTLGPGLQHVASFTKAISSAAQAEPHLTLTWGAIQAIMESACQNNYAVDDMLNVVATLTDTLPDLAQYADLLNRSAKLQFQLQELYDTYMEYCIASVQYIKRSGIANLLFTIIYSSPQRLLKSTQAKIVEQTKAFRRVVAEVTDWESQHQAIQTAMTTKPLSDTSTTSSTEVDQEIDFPVSTIVYRKNYTFVARDDLLGKMHNVFKPKIGQPSQPQPSAFNAKAHLHSPSCYILHGLGGIGKTQVALEYSYRYRQEYDAVFWIRAGSSHALADGFAEVCRKLQLDLDIEDPRGQDQGRVMEKVKSWLAKTEKRWLLIFDNAEDMDDLNPYFPFDILGSGHVIVTTQKADFYPVTDPAVTDTCKVTDLERSDGAAIVFKYLRRSPHDDDEEEFARKISDLVGGLPLALVTIGGYLYQTESSVSDYYDNLSTSSRAWEASAVGFAKQYEKRLATVFDHALESLSDNARSLINMLAFLSPDSIPEEMFKNNIGTDRLPFISSEAEFIHLIADLRKRQLVWRNTLGGESFLSIHRTVQWCVLLNLSKDNDHRWAQFQKTFELLRSCLPVTSSIDNPEPQNLAMYNRYVPQLLNIRSHCLWPEPPVELPVDFAQVLSDMATYMWQIGMLGQGRDAMCTAERILQRYHVEQCHPLRTRLHEHIGIIASYYGVSERDEAWERRRKARAARKAEYEAIPDGKRTLEDKIRRWNVESDLAFGYLQWENLEACEKQWDKCLAQYQEWGNEEMLPFEYVKYNHGISYVRMAQGRPVDAIKHAKKSAELAEICAGPKHPTTYLCRFSLTNLLYLANELDAALEESKKVVQARCEICGEYNNRTLEAYAFHASLLAEKGLYAEAEKYYLKCLDRRKWSYWNREGVARTQYLYAKTLQYLGRSAEADIQFERARKTKAFYVKTYPQWLKNDEENEMVVFDQMVSMWAGRYTGKCRQQIQEFQDAIDVHGVRSNEDSGSSGQGASNLSIQLRMNSAFSNTGSDSTEPEDI